jgi:hypothetical protein
MLFDFDPNRGCGNVATISQTGRPDWANFCLLGDCLLWTGV